MIVKSVAAGDGWIWIRGGFDLFRQNPVIWIALFFIYLLIGMALSIVPAVGSIIFNLLAPVFMAGFMLGCQALESGEELEINHLFAGFKHNTTQLITVGGIYLAGIIIIVGLVFVTTGGAMMAIGTRSPGVEDALMPAILAALALLMPLIMAYWFAPILVIFHGLKAVDAMKLSFSACLKNIWPFTIFSLIAMALMIMVGITVAHIAKTVLNLLQNLAALIQVLAAIPLGIGLVVLVLSIASIMIASLYVSYRDIFSEEVVA